MSHLGDVDLSMPRALLGPGVGTAQGVLVKSPVAVFNHRISVRVPCEPLLNFRI